MSSTSVVSIARGRHVYSLEAQREAPGREAPKRLVLCCEELDRAGAPSWQRALEPALELRSPGASLDDAGLREALHFAVAELGVEELILVLHSRCSHLLPDSLPHSLSGTECAEPAHERALPFMDRMYGRMERSHRQLEAAREQVRDTIRELAGDATLGALSTLGLVQIVESGVLLVYDPERDDFEALL